jgi:hypothetical protein
MIISRLEGEVLVLHLVESARYVLEKIIDVDSPPKIELVKKGEIKNYVRNLKYFKVVWLL